MRAFEPQRNFTSIYKKNHRFFSKTKKVRDIFRKFFENFSDFRKVPGRPCRGESLYNMGFAIIRPFKNTQAYMFAKRQPLQIGRAKIEIFKIGSFENRRFSTSLQKNLPSISGSRLNLKLGDIFAIPLIGTIQHCVSPLASAS